MGSLLDGLEETSTIIIPKDPFAKILGQEQAVTLVHTAVMQRRHVLLCGVPGVGKSLLAKAAYSLLPEPTQEIRIQRNQQQQERPFIRIVAKEPAENVSHYVEPESLYIRPEKLPFEVAVVMGYRCPRCMILSSPEFNICLECNSMKRSEWGTIDSFHGLMHALDVINEPALATFSRNEDIHDDVYQVTYTRTPEDLIFVSRIPYEQKAPSENTVHDDEHLLISQNASRFVRISGTNPVELLGDVRHDPYGSAEGLGLPPHKRVIPGAIHEAHEGILYVDEIAALGSYQKHLLTAMQDRSYTITAHNPHSSGASVRVDNVPCDFLLFAACNIEDLSQIIPPLRSRIKGYGYEIMLKAWMKKSTSSMEGIVQFIAQTVEEDGRIPHFSVDGVESIIAYAERIALQFDGQRDAITLRLRELGGLIRMAGDLAVKDNLALVDKAHVEDAYELYQGIDVANPTNMRQYSRHSSTDSYGDYFF